MGNSSLILEVEDEETETLALELDGPADEALSPGQALSPKASISEAAWTVWISELSTSPSAALWAAAFVKASGSVWSSGEELDLLRVVPCVKSRSDSFGPGVERAGGG